MIEILFYRNKQLVGKITRERIQSAVSVMNCNIHLFDGISIYHNREFIRSSGECGEYSGCEVFTPPRK